MAMRDIQVKLSARVDSYVAAMNRAKSATGALSNESVRNMANVGASMQRMGRSASLYVTAPILAAGGASINMAREFENSFSVMEGLANVPASEIAKLKESVLGLAGETAVAPQELADALYFAASAGLDSAQAMDVLDKAARASAAGMGPTSDIVGLVAGAVAAYGPEVLSAAEATDVLTAAIREGRADPQELAGALGRVTPIAAAMGISFGETAGAAAYMSNIMGNTDETITALRGVMLSLLDPSQQGKAALESIGTSADELRNIIREQGLVAAFQHLKDLGLNPASEAMSNLFEDNRALNGAMILLNDESGRLQPVIDAVTNSAGSLGDAFGAVADDEGFKLKQAFVDVQVALTELGTLLLPFAADVASAASTMIEAFQDLPGPLQAVVGGFVALAALTGPIVGFAGTVLRNFGLLATGFDKTVNSTSRIVSTLSRVALVAGVAYAAWNILGEGHLNTSAHIDTASTALQTETVAAYNAAVAAGMATTEVDALAIAHTALSNAIAAAASAGDGELAEAMDTLNVSADAYLGTILQLGAVNIPMEDNIKAIALAERYFNLANGEGAIFLDLMYNGNLSVEELANTVGASVEEVEAFAQALQLVSTYSMENKHEVDELADTFLDAQVRMGGASAEAVALAESIAGSRDEAGNATNVYLEFMKALVTMEPAERDAIITTDGFVAALEDLPPELQAGMEALSGFGYESEQMAMRSADAIDTVSNMADEIKNLTTVQGFYTQAIDDTFGPMQNLERARDAVRLGIAEFTEALDDNNHTMDESTTAGLANRAVVMDQADAILDFAKAQIQSGMAIEQVEADYKANIQHLRDTAIAAGLAEEDVDALLETYGMTPETLNTAINLAGDALAKWRVDRYLEKLDEIPEEEAVIIEALIDEGDYAGAIARLNAIPDSQTYNVYLNTVGSINLPGFGGFWGAEGGYFNRATPMIIGEAGPEVLLPLTDPARMRHLAGMPQVAGPLMSALGVGQKMTAAPAMMGSVATAEAVAPNINIYVYNHGKREIGPSDIEHALIKAGVGGK